MKQTFTLIILALLHCMGVSATEVQSTAEPVRYITLKDGQLIAIPEKYILDEEEANGICTLTLEGDTTFTYAVSNVDNISDTYNGTPASMLSFSFTHEDNDQVFADVVANIEEQGDSILVTADVPVIGKRLRPAFTLSEGASLWFDGVQQVSGQSSHRFTSPVIYTLAQPKHWIYEVTAVEPDDNGDGQWKATQIDISSVSTTNAPSNYGEDIDNLWDNNTSTFFHSTWGSGTHTALKWKNNGYYGDGVTEWPYIEIQLAESIDNLRFAYTTSAQPNRFPQGWNIKAKDKTTGKWESIGTLDMTEDKLPQTSITEYTSPVFPLGKQYSAIRIELTKASYKNYMVLAELSLYSCKKIDTTPAEPTFIKSFKPFGRPCKVSVKYLTDYATGDYKVPTIYLTFGDGKTWDATQWIGQTLPDGTNTKEEWIDDCTFRLDGAGVWPDIETVEGCQIRGRGNSSWTYNYKSKNPYRIKLPKKAKQAPFNLIEDRQWVFIANKQNGSMTTNAIAQKVAGMVDVDAVCHMIPFEMYINGHYRGSYCFSEKIKISDNSVDISDKKGCLLELDDYFDEDTKFKDPTYGLPVNVKDPDFTEEDNKRTVTITDIQNSFNSFTATLAANGDITKLIDIDSWARFWLVNDLVRNVETHHPKSCYLFNENPADGDRWRFGPAWDFDWAFGYEETHNYFIAGADTDLFSAVASQGKAGMKFYNAIRNTSAGKRAYYKEWVNFMAEGRLQELLEYIDDYTEFAIQSLKHNNEAPVNERDSYDYMSLAEKSKQWISTRANYIFNSLDKFDVSPDIIEPEDYGQPNNIEETESENNINRPVNVYTIGGVLVRRQVPYLKSTDGLAPGIYIIGGKTTIVQ